MPTAGQRILATDFTAAVTASEGTDHLNITTTLTAGSPACDLTFVAPTSGKALVIIGARIRDDGNQSTPIIDSQLYLGTSAGGTLVYDTGNENRRIEIITDNSTRTQNHTKSWLATGLTPGSTYYVRIMHAVGAGGGTTADILNRTITVVPLPA